MITRRRFIAGAFAAISAPLAAQQKNAERVYRIGVLDLNSVDANAANMNQFRKGLRELGYDEGRNLIIEYHRSADGRAERYPALAAELTRLNVDLILTRGTPATLAAKRAPGRIPVVMAWAIDPVDTGLVASFERPGGKVTGVALSAHELETKRIELLRALAPGSTQLAAIMNMGNPALVYTWKVIEAAARSMGLPIALIDMRKPEDISRAFDAAVAQRANALIVRTGGLVQADRQTIAGLAAKHRLPAIYSSRQFVDAGGLVSYGVNIPHMYYRAATLVDKIFKGSNPADLPVERPSKFELVINRKALRALGLVIPPDLLLRSDEIVG